MRPPIQDNDSYIGQLLIKDGIINRDDLTRGLEEQKRAQDHLCATLVRMGFASEEKVFSILSLQIGIPYLNLKDAQIDPVVLHRMPVKLARAFKCVLLRFVDGVPFLAMADPLNTRAVKEIQAYLGVDKAKIFLAGDQEITLALQKYYEPAS